MLAIKEINKTNILYLEEAPCSKRGLLFLTVLLLLFSFSSITNEVSASSSFDKGKYKKAMTRVILNQQAYLMVNVTGVDGKGNELLSLIMSSFLLNLGLHLQKKN